jgi:hypothetical protein
LAGVEIVFLENNMSSVTDVILTMTLCEGTVEDNRYPAVEFINAWLSERGKGELKRVDNFSGGRKSMQAVVFMGALNYLEIPEFVCAVAAAPWEYRECLALFLKDEEDDRFTDMTPNAPAQG